MLTYIAFSQLTQDVLLCLHFFYPACSKEGADFAYRGNDDSKLPETRMDWVDAFILDLRQRSPVPNIGIVGPACEQGAKHILTHDFTHRTHAIMFGWHYPRSLPDWSSDDWITFGASVISLSSCLPTSDERTLRM